MNDDEDGGSCFSETLVPTYQAVPCFEPANTSVHLYSYGNFEFRVVMNPRLKKRKWSWIGHTLRKPSGITEKGALDWNPQGKRRRVRVREGELG
jgi:hypothetical protein